MSKQLNKQTNILITATLFALHGMSWAIKAETWYETEDKIKVLKTILPKTYFQV